MPSSWLSGSRYFITECEGGGVEAGDWLVGQHQLWLLHQGAGDATRCCCPPESWSARMVALSRMPTRASFSSAFCLSRAGSG